METSGAIQGALTSVEHVKAELIRNLSEMCDFEVEVRCHRMTAKDVTC